MSPQLRLLPQASPGRRGRDRLEMLTALIEAPSFDPLYRTEIIQIPPFHGAYAWGCQVPECERARAQLKSAGLCSTHGREWDAFRGSGRSKAEFLSTATPLKASTGVAPGLCRICPERPAKPQSASGLCLAHDADWRTVRGPSPSSATFDAWLSEQAPLPGFGQCKVTVCSYLAAVAFGLCQGHQERYARDRWPGGARVKRSSTCARRGPDYAVVYDDEAKFLAWCDVQVPLQRQGRLSLMGLPPLLRAEIQWGLAAHAQDARRSMWPTTSIQQMINGCRSMGATSLTDADFTTLGQLPRYVARGIRDKLRVVYYDEAEAKAAGYLETHYYGRGFPHAGSRIDLTGIKVLWLRDLVWEHFVELFRSPKCPRSRGPIDWMRHGCLELSAFLAIDAPEGGQDPRLLGKEHAQRFVADQLTREREGLVSLGMRRSRNGTTSIVTPVTRRLTFNQVRKILFTALETGRAAEIGLDPAFITAVPFGGTDPKPSRAPFSDEVLRALADEANLRILAEVHDPHDRGVRDMWEAIVVTGRRCGEVVNLRLECIGRYSGLAMLWHDQTKVGNLNEGIRIPEPLYLRLDERRHTTITRFEHRNGRLPTAQERSKMALFPSSARNPYEVEAITTTTFHTAFRNWVDGLDLSGCVPHQARHTLATRLLRHGASLAHIRKYLGQVSDRMAEHYAKVADTDLDEILQAVWVAGPGAANPGELLGSPAQPLDRHQAMALALDLSRRSTPAYGGFCTFQPVVDGGACPWNVDCENCDKFVMSGADLLYWRRKAEQWRSIAERAPDDATADYLHKVFEPTARAIEGLEKALAGLGLLHEALDLDLRRPQNYFHRLWSTGFLASDLAQAANDAPGAPILEQAAS